MNFGWAETVTILGGEFVYHEFVQDSLDVLKVGHVTPRSDDRMVSDWMETLNIFEPSKRAIRCW
jgi:hypothetical protein